MSGLAGLLAGCILGGGGWTFGKTWGEPWSFVPAGIGAGLAGVILPCFLSGYKRYLLAGAWFVLSVPAVIFFHYHVGRQMEGQYFKWGLAASVIAVVVGASCEPMRLASGGDLFYGARTITSGQALMRDAVQFLAFILKLFSRRFAGTVLAGAVGGLLGGAFVGGVLAAVGGRDVGLRFGSIFVIPVIVSVLGLLGGAFGGWKAWLICNGRMEPSLPEGDT